MVVSLAIQSWTEGEVNAGVVVLNLVVGVFQEVQIEKTMHSLRSLGSPSANVVRGDQTINISTANIVGGDIVELNTRDGIRVDSRYVVTWFLIHSQNSMDRIICLLSSGSLNPSDLKPTRRYSRASHFLFLIEEEAVS